jgi:hypothetical protein
MTMRQVVGLMKVINRADMVSFYNSILSYRASQSPKLPSLEEFLSVALKDKDQKENVFDEKADKQLEQYALKRLEERRKNV